MKKFLRKYIDKIIIVLVLVALAVLVWRMADNLKENLVATKEANLLDKIVMEKGDLTVLFSLKSGMNKPVFLNKYEDALVEFSAWSSQITVDGSSTTLWEHDSGLRLDGENSTLFYSMTSAPMRTVPVKNYIVEEVITLDKEKATVEYYFIPNELISKVTLILGHYGWYFSDLKLEDDEVTMFHSDLNKMEWENNEKPIRMSTIKIKLLTKPEKEMVNRNVHGIYNFDITYTLENPKIFERNLLDKEEIYLEEVRRIEY